MFSYHSIKQLASIKNDHDLDKEGTASTERVYSAGMTPLSAHRKRAPAPDAVEALLQALAAHPHVAERIMKALPCECPPEAAVAPAHQTLELLPRQRDNGGGLSR